MMEHWPAEDFTLDKDKFTRKLRSTRKGAAPGSSGMTSEHLRYLLSHLNDVLMLHRMGKQLARGQVPQVVIEAIRVGRMTALQKLDGVDFLRRLVGRTIAQKINPIVERCTAPFQYALTTRVGIECVAHALQALTEEKPEAVMSLDGISAFDLISRKSMPEGLCRIPGGEVFPFVRMFYVHPCISGKTIRGWSTTSGKGRVHYCIRWGSTLHWCQSRRC